MPACDTCQPTGVWVMACVTCKTIAWCIEDRTHCFEYDRQSAVHFKAAYFIFRFSFDIFYPLSA